MIYCLPALGFSQDLQVIYLMNKICQMLHYVMPNALKPLSLAWGVEPSLSFLLRLRVLVCPLPSLQGFLWSASGLIRPDFQETHPALQRKVLMCIHSCNYLVTLKNSGHWTHPGNPHCYLVFIFSSRGGTVLREKLPTDTLCWGSDTTLQSGSAATLDQGGEDREQESSAPGSWSKRRFLVAGISVGQHKSSLCIHCKPAWLLLSICGLKTADISFFLSETSGKMFRM